MGQNLIPRINKETLEFVIGIRTSDKKKGWDEGVYEIGLGEKAKLSITPDYGYGAQGAGGVIPPNAHLYFEVSLLKIGSKGGSSGGCSVQ